MIETLDPGVAELRNVLQLIITHIHRAALTQFSRFLFQLPVEEHGDGEEDDEHAEDEHNNDHDVVECVTKDV